MGFVVESSDLELAEALMVRAEAEFETPEETSQTPEPPVATHSESRNNMLIEWSCCFDTN
jgi:hypothetical protein